MADKSTAKNPPKGNAKKAPAPAKPKEELKPQSTDTSKATKATAAPAPSTTSATAPVTGAPATTTPAGTQNAVAQPQKNELKEIRGVIVSGLPPDYTVEELRELGAAYGRLTQARLYKYDSATLTRQGYLQYNDRADAGYAQYMLEGKEHRKLKLSAKCKNLTRDDFVPAQKKKQQEDPKQKKVRIKKNPGALRFLSPLNPSTEALRGIPPQPVQNQQLGYVPPPSNENWPYPPEAGAPAVHLPDASVDHNPRHISPPQNEEFDQDYVQQTNDWYQPRNNNNQQQRNNNNNRNNSGGRGRGGRGRGGRGRGGRGNGKGGRRTEYVPADNTQVSDQQFNQSESVEPFSQLPHQQNQRPQKQFKIKQQSDAPLESSPAPQEPQVPVQQKTNNNAKKPNNNPPKRNNNNKGGQSPAPQSPPANQSPAPVVDEYEIIISHVKTKDPKTKFRIPAEQHANFLASIQSFLPN